MHLSDQISAIRDQDRERDASLRTLITDC